jgi:hypothetical protein
MVSMNSLLISSHLILIISFNLYYRAILRDIFYNLLVVSK